MVAPDRKLHMPTHNISPPTAQPPFDQLPDHVVTKMRRVIADDGSPMTMALHTSIAHGGGAWRVWRPGWNRWAQITVFTIPTVSDESGQRFVLCPRAPEDGFALCPCTLERGLDPISVAEACRILDVIEPDVVHTPASPTHHRIWEFITLVKAHRAALRHAAFTRRSTTDIDAANDMAAADVRKTASRLRELGLDDTQIALATSLVEAGHDDMTVFRMTHTL